VRLFSALLILTVAVSACKKQDEVADPQKGPSKTGGTDPVIMQNNQVNYSYVDSFGVKQKGQFVGLLGANPNCVISTTTASKVSFSAALADANSRLELGVSALGGSATFSHFHDVVENAQDGTSVSDNDLSTIVFPNSSLTVRFGSNPAVYNSTLCKFTTPGLATITQIGAGGASTRTGLVFSVNCPLMSGTNINSQIESATLSFTCQVEESTQN